MIAKTGRAIILISFLFLAGCSSFDGYVKRSEVTAQITQLETKHRSQLEEAVEALSKAKDSVIIKQTEQLQEAANKLYGANEAFRYYSKPNRLDLIINNRVTEAQAAIALAPTYSAIEEENRRLARELDETKTTLVQLQDRHAEAIGLNSRLSDEAAGAKTRVTELERSKTDLENNQRKEREGLQSRLNQANERIISFERSRADNREAIERMKVKLMSVAGLVALGCLGAAVWSPVFKGKFAVLAAVFGLATVAIPFVEAWMIAGVLGVILLLVLGWLALEHHTTDRAATNMVNAIQDTKEGSGTLKDNLSAWNTSYVKKAGEYTEETDKKVERWIDSKLMQFGRLNTKNDSKS